MSEVEASASTTIVQAAEHFVIDEAKAIAKTVTTKNVTETKSIVDGVAKEAVASSGDSVPTAIQNVEHGAKAIGTGILKGAIAGADFVEKHPELITIAALATGIGAVSLVQPKLVVGSVSLLRKMASDAVKETVNEVVIESSTGIVKGVSKEVTEHTADLAAQDAAEKAKLAALEVAKDGTKAGVEATMDIKSTGNSTTEVIAKQDVLKDGEIIGTKILTNVSGDATAIIREVVPDNIDGAVKGPVISEETVHISATATGEIKPDSKIIMKEGPAIVVTTNDITGDVKTIVQKGSTTTFVEQAEVPKDGEEKQVTVATVDIKSLAKEIAREMAELEAKAVKGSPSAVQEQAKLKNEDNPTIVEETPTLKELGVVYPDNTNIKTSEPVQTTKSLVTSPQEGPKVSLDPINAVFSIPEPAIKIPTPKTELDNAVMPTHHAATHAAVLEAHSRITVLHEDNELLHQKLDAMQEALLAITKVLTERPLVPNSTETLVVPQSTTEVSSESELVATESNQLVLASPPLPAALVNKRMSVFGSIGWLFGVGGRPKKHKRGQSIATSTPASVPTVRSQG